METGVGTDGKGGFPARNWGNLTLLHRTQETTEPLQQIKSIPEVIGLPAIPESLVELSTRSMQSLQGSKFNPRPVSLVEMGVDDADLEDRLEIGGSITSSGLKRCAKIGRASCRERV